VEACRREHEARRWSLGGRGEAPLAPDRTLDQAGLYQGAILELRAEEPPGLRTRRRHLASWSEVGVYHARRAVADAWHAAASRLPERLGAASAQVRSQGPAVAPGRAAAPLPAAAERRQLSEPDRRIASAVLPRGLLIAVFGRER